MWQCCFPSFHLICVFVLEMSEYISEIEMGLGRRGNEKMAQILIRH